MGYKLLSVPHANATFHIIKHLIAPERSRAQPLVVTTDRKTSETIDNATMSQIRLLCKNPWARFMVFAKSGAVYDGIYGV